MSKASAYNFLNVVEAFGEQKTLDRPSLGQSFTAESLYYLSREVTPEDAIEDGQVSKNRGIKHRPDRPDAFLGHPVAANLAKLAMET
jgi:hypothetical protein